MQAVFVASRDIKTQWMKWMEGKHDDEKKDMKKVLLFLRKWSEHTKAQKSEEKDAYMMCSSSAVVCGVFVE